MYASATVDMWLSLVLCSLSCVILHLWGDNNKLGLQIGESAVIILPSCNWCGVFTGVGLQGAGTAAVFSTTFLWLETLMPITNAIGAAYTVAWNVAVQVVVWLSFSYKLSFIIQIYSLLIGQYIVTNPQIFLYAMSFTVICCIVNFAIANLLAISVNKNKKK